MNSYYKICARKYTLPPNSLVAANLIHCFFLSYFLAVLLSCCLAVLLSYCLTVLLYLLNNFLDDLCLPDPSRSSIKLSFDNFRTNLFYQLLLPLRYSHQRCLRDLSFCHLKISLCGMLYFQFKGLITTV